MSLKCYSDWKFGAIQIDLTPLTPLITEEDYAFSAKQAVDGSVIIAGATTPSSYGTENILIVKIK
jgi:hypothetical protein